MKLFKLVKSIDYVTYPVYKELLKISKTVNDSLSNFKTILVSAAIGVLFDASPLSQYIVNLLKEQPLPKFLLKTISGKNAPLFLSIIIALLFYAIVCAVHWVAVRYSSNKNTVEKQNDIVDEFYAIAIPQLIEVKSILEQVDEDNSNDDRKKLLLLLQAKHEIQKLNKMLHQMCIIEHGKLGNQTDDSQELAGRIGKCAYITFLEEMLVIIYKIYEGLKGTSSPMVNEDMGELRAIVLSVGVFDKVSEIKETLNGVRNSMKNKSM